MDQEIVGTYTIALQVSFYYKDVFQLEFNLFRLCGQAFGLLGPSKIICDDCRKPVCSKCSIELHLKNGTKYVIKQGVLSICFLFSSVFASL